MYTEYRYIVDLVRFILFKLWFHSYCRELELFLQRKVLRFSLQIFKSVNIPSICLHSKNVIITYSRMVEWLHCLSAILHNVLKRWLEMCSFPFLSFYINGNIFKIILFYKSQIVFTKAGKQESTKAENNCQIICRAFTWGLSGPKDPVFLCIY